MTHLFVVYISPPYQNLFETFIKRITNVPNSEVIGLIYVRSKDSYSELDLPENVRLFALEQSTVTHAVNYALSNREIVSKKYDWYHFLVLTEELLALNFKYWTSMCEEKKNMEGTNGLYCSIGLYQIISDSQYNGDFSFDSEYVEERKLLKYDQPPKLFTSKTLTELKGCVRLTKYQIHTTPGIQFNVFEEIMNAFKLELSKKGIPVQTSVGYFELGSHIRTIHFGTHGYMDRSHRITPKDIVYNLEQLSDSSPYNVPAYMSILRSSELWDYNKDNIRWLESKGISAKLVPIGHSEAFVYKNFPEVKESEKDIDVLFLGSNNERRNNFLSSLTTDTSIKLVYLDGVYSSQREMLVRRSKIVLNIHYYSMARLELSRIGPLMANKVFVISEEGCIPEENDTFREGVVFIRVGDQQALLENVKKYLSDEKERRRIAERGYEIYESKPMVLPIV